MKNKPRPRKIYQYKKAVYGGFKRELQDITPEFLQMASSSEVHINSLWNELVEKCIPQKLIRGTKTRKPLTEST